LINWKIVRADAQVPLLGLVKIYLRLS